MTERPQALPSPEDIRRLQDAHLHRRQTLDPRRPILINHEAVDPAGWHPWPCIPPEPGKDTKGRCPRGREPIWGWTLLENQLFLDHDAEDWGSIYREASKFAACCGSRSIEVENSFTGTKAHQSIYFDIASLGVLPGDMRQPLEVLGGDVPKVVRRTLFGIIVREAGLDIEASGVDTAKINWSKGSKGSVERAYGAAKPGGRPKTWLPAGIPSERPVDPPLLLPTRLPKLFSLEPWREEILTAIRQEAERLRTSYSNVEEGGVLPANFEALARRPWWQHVIAPPAGFHDQALRALVLLAKDMGLSTAEVINFMGTWRPQPPCSSPDSHTVGSDAWRHRIEDFMGSNWHFSSAKLQEDLQLQGFLPKGPILSRAAFLGIEGKRAWRFPLEGGVRLIIQEAREGKRRNWRFVYSLGDRESAPFVVPMRARDGVPNLQPDKEYRRRILNVLWDFLAATGQSKEVKATIEAQMKDAFDVLLKHQGREARDNEEAQAGGDAPEGGGGIREETFLELPDGRIAEEILTEDGEEAFSVYDPATDTTASAAQVEADGVIYRPLPIDPKLRKARALTLATGAEEYGTVLQLLKEMEALASEVFDPMEEGLILRMWVRGALVSWIIGIIFDWSIEKYASIFPTIGPSESGKGRILTVMRMLCYRSIYFLKTHRVPSMFRVLDPWQGTLILEEADVADSAEAAEFIEFVNSRATGVPIPRYSAEGDKVGWFYSFGATILALRKAYTDDGFNSRSVHLKAEATTKNDIPLIPSPEWIAKARVLQRKLLLWRSRQIAKIRRGQVRIPTRVDIEGVKSFRVREAFLVLAALKEEEPKLVEDMVTIAKEMDRRLVAERAGSPTGLILGVVYSHLDDNFDPVKVGEGYRLEGVVKFKEDGAQKEELRALNLRTVSEALSKAFSPSEVARYWRGLGQEVKGRDRVGGKLFAGILIVKDPDRLDREFLKYVPGASTQAKKYPTPRLDDYKTQIPVDPEQPEQPEQIGGVVQPVQPVQAPRIPGPNLIHRRLTPKEVAEMACEGCGGRPEWQVQVGIWLGPVCSPCLPRYNLKPQEGSP